MIKWNTLADAAGVNEIVDQSRTQAVLIFKHSTRCSISSIAKHRLESDWDFDAKELVPFYLDLIAHRDISNLVAEKFSVYHESPQVLLIRDGECTYDASHLDITVAEIHECFESQF